MAAQNCIDTPSNSTTPYYSRFNRLLAFCHQHALFLALLCILILLRNGIVIFDMWSLNEGGDLPEGLIHGNFAFDILDGNWRGWPAYLYRVRGHLGNELIVGILAMPLYLLFGNSLFVLSQVPTIYSTGIVLLIYYVCNRWMNKEIALIAAALFVCAPLAIQGWAAYPYCIHLESAFFSLLAIILFLRMHEAETERGRILFSAALGITSGIGIFHSVIYLLTLGCIVLFWLQKNKVFYKKKEFLFFLLFMSLGLIPYSYFGSDTVLVFFKKLIAGKFSGTYLKEIQTNSYTRTLMLMSILFWPVNNLLFSQVSGLTVTFIGGAGVLGCGFALKKMFTSENILFSILMMYCALYLLIAIVTQVGIQYYLFPIYAHMIIIMAACCGKMRAKYLSHKRNYNFLFIIIMFGICAVNVYRIARHFEPEKFIPQLKKQLAIKGCCFYWPWGYLAPAGLKTDITFEVEKIASQTVFKMKIVGNVPIKTIFVSKRRRGEFPLKSPQSYIVYGKDISFTGLTQLVGEIESRAPADGKDYAYKGLAVYYINDNWLADLLEEFKAGIIKDLIPGPYQHYFYGELTRKIKNKYKNNPDKVKKTIGMFNGRERDWMLKTKIIYNTFTDGRRIVYQKIDSNP